MEENSNMTPLFIHVPSHQRTASAMEDPPHLQALVGQGSSVEGLLVVCFQFQCGVTVLLGISKPFQLQEAQRSANITLSLLSA